MYLIGVDIGTSSAKAVAITSGGNTVASAQQSYTMQEPVPGQRVQRPKEIMAAVLDIMGDVVQQLPTNTSIGSVGFSAAMHSIMAVDDKGEPLTDLVIWADTRSQHEVALLKASGEAGYLYQNCGVPVHPATPLSKLMWMRSHEPAVYKQAHKFVSIKEFILFHLTGKFVVDYSVASATGFFNIHQLAWDEIALGFAGIEPNRLATPVPITHQLALKPSQLASSVGLPANVVLVVGSSDGNLANVGSRVVTDEELAVTIGTSAAVRVTSNRPHFDEQESIFNYVLTPGTFVSGGASNNGTVLLKWMAEAMLNNKDFNDAGRFIEEAFKSPPGSRGLMILPYLLGERAPVWDAAATAVITGLRFDHTHADWMRALLEGITMNVQIIIRNLLESTGDVKRIVASGGFTESKQWVQMLADISNLPVALNNAGDASAIGAALVGGYSIGIIESLIQSPEPPGAVFYPDAALHEVYGKMQAGFDELYKKNHAQ